MQITGIKIVTVIAIVAHVTTRSADVAKCTTKSNANWPKGTNKNYNCGTPSNLAYRGNSIKATQHTNTIFHPAHAGGAFIFPCYNIAQYKRLQWLLYHLCSYTAHAAKQRTGLYRSFSCYLPCFAAVVWRVHPPIPHHPRHVRAYHSAAAPQAYARYHHHAGHYTGQRSRPIIIMYI